MVNKTLEQNMLILLWAIVMSVVFCSAVSADNGFVKQPKRSNTTPKIIFVINTNLDKNQQGSAQKISTAIRRISNYSTRIVHYKSIGIFQIQQFIPAGIILSGQGSPWDMYTAESLKSVIALIKQSRCPILGICGGHQLIALAYGGHVDRIKRLKSGRGYDGCWKESGYLAVSIQQKDLLLGNEGGKLSVYESHYDEVKSVPKEFIITASNNSCRVQAMRHQKQSIYGVQFHPEEWDSDHRDGRRILQRFLDICSRYRY